jgi:hypothetical protein
MFALAVVIHLAQPPATAPATPVTPAARLTNAGFERGLSGWRAEGHRGIRAEPERHAAWSSDRAAEGRGWLNVGWRGRSGAPPGAEKRITFLLDARPYRGRRLRLSAMTRAPDFAAGSSSLIARIDGTETGATIGASPNWQRHHLDFRVPRDARRLEIGFVVAGTGGELDADAVRLQRLR